MSLADVVSESQEPAACVLDGSCDVEVQDRLARLESAGVRRLGAQGFSADSIRAERYLNCRYQGSSTQLMIEEPVDRDFARAFVKEHEQQFGFILHNRPILCDDIRVRSVGRSAGSTVESPYAEYKGARLRHCNTGDSAVRKSTSTDWATWTPALFP
jgi:5-oxoprolinase (ATP-hydrolysing)